MASELEGEQPLEPEPGRAPSPRVRRALRATAGTLQRYPRDLDRLTWRLAELHQVEPGAIVLSSGGASALLERVLAAVGSPNDELVSPFPTFELVSALASRAGMRHRHVPALQGPDGLFAPHQAGPLLAAIGPRTRAVYLATPDNPTGVMLPPAEERALREGLSAQVALVLDEAWSLQVPGDPPWAGSGAQAQAVEAPAAARGGGRAAARAMIDVPNFAMPMIDSQTIPGRTSGDPGGSNGGPVGRGGSGGGCPVVRVRSLSKLHGLAGLRIGYGIASPELAGLLHRLQLPFPLGAPQVAAALAALEELPRARRIAQLLRRKRERLAAGIRALGLLASAGDSPLILVRDPAPGASAGRLLFALRAARVAAQEAHWDPAALTLSVGTPAQDRRALAALARALG